MSKKHVKKRIRNKHLHHEEHLRESIREEVLEEFVEQEQRLLAREQKLLDRIDYLVGANNEAFDLLRKCEEGKVGKAAEKEERQYDEIRFNRKPEIWPKREETASEALISDPF
tara:strand:- start:2 stop:340 length:339 start_codon:yes stop_codon:yes gene_type:complete